jgi:hypothetical protein
LRKGGGVTYSTTDKELINQFIEIMKSTTYTKTDSSGAVGGSRMFIYDPNGKEIENIYFAGKGIVRVNDFYYKMNTDIDKQLETLFKKFLTELNLE